MADTWITDMSHFDVPDEEAHKLPRPAVLLATYLASIVEGTVGRPTLTGPTGVRCRRRPGRRRCPSVILSELSPNGDQLQWRCPTCGDNGLISNWAGTRWDPARTARHYRSGQALGKQLPGGAATPATTTLGLGETIQGIIEYDEDSDGELPKVATAHGDEYGWVELGKKLIIYEGWRIKIDLS